MDLSDNYLKQTQFNTIFSQNKGNGPGGFEPTTSVNNLGCSYAYKGAALEKELLKFNLILQLGKKRVKERGISICSLLLF
jgi:hypothetical protein